MDVQCAEWVWDVSSIYQYVVELTVWRAHLHFILELCKRKHKVCEWRLVMSQQFSHLAGTAMWAPQRTCPKSRTEGNKHDRVEMSVSWVAFNCVSEKRPVRIKVGHLAGWVSYDVVCHSPKRPLPKPKPERNLVCQKDTQ